MASYDTSVIVKCIDAMKGKPRGDPKACEVIFSDDNCVLPPTTVKELEFKPREEVKVIFEHCKTLTYNDYPFTEKIGEVSNREHVDEFADYIRLEWLDKYPSGSSEKNRLKRAFNRTVEIAGKPRKQCQGSGTFEHRVNDYRIYKESNILAEYGIVDKLISADWSHTNPTCQSIYEKIMEEFIAEDVDEKYRENHAIKVCFYKDKKCISS